MVQVIDKRKERRIKVNLSIKLAYQNNRQVRAATENISRLGTYVEIGRKIPPGTSLDITLEIPVYGEDPSLAGEAKCKGDVFRCNLIKEDESKKYYGIGIFFTDFPQETDRDKLSQYIDFLIRQEDKSIKAGAKRWHKKREMAKRTPRARQVKQDNYQTGSAKLLKQALSRLEEIYRLLKSQDRFK